MSSMHLGSNFELTAEDISLISLMPNDMNLQLIVILLMVHDHMDSVISLQCYLKAPFDYSKVQKKEECVFPDEQCGLAIVTLDGKKHEYRGCLNQKSCSPSYVNCLTFCDTDLCIPDSAGLEVQLRSESRKNSPVKTLSTIGLVVDFVTKLIWKIL